MHCCQNPGLNQGPLNLQSNAPNWAISAVKQTSAACRKMHLQNIQWQWPKTNWETLSTATDKIIRERTVGLVAVHDTGEDEHLHQRQNKSSAHITGVLLWISAVQTRLFFLQIQLGGPFSSLFYSCFLKPLNPFLSVCLAVCCGNVAEQFCTCL